MQACFLASSKPGMAIDMKLDLGDQAGALELARQHEPSRAAALALQLALVWSPAASSLHLATIEHVSCSLRKTTQDYEKYNWRCILTRTDLQQNILCFRRFP